MKEAAHAGPGRSLFLLAGLMEVCWIYGWANFSVPVLIQRQLYAAGGFVVMALAFFLTRISAGRGWRAIWTVLLHCAGFACGSLVMLHGGFFGSHPLFDGKWALYLLSGMKDTFTCFSIVIYLIWSVLLWWAGFGLARRPLSYISVCRRFDAGLAAFFVLFLFKLVLVVKGGVVQASSLDVSLAALFLMSGLCAIGLAGSDTGAKKSYMTGRRHRGIFIVFTCTVVAIAGCLVLLFLSQGQFFSDAGRTVFYGIGNFIGPLFVNAVRFLFMPNRMRQEPASGGSGASGPDVSKAAGEAAGWMGPVGSILVFAVSILCAAALLFSLIYCLFLLFRRLSARGDRQQSPGGGVMIDLFSFMKKCLSVFRGALGAFRAKHRIHTAGDLYVMLLGWGRRSGIVRSVYETPSEFGERLKAVFPVLAGEIDAIVNGFNREVYGEIALDTGELGVLRSSIRRMVSPRWWPLRIRSFFTGR